MIAGSGGLNTRSRGMPSTSIHFIEPARPRAQNFPMKTENNKCKNQEFPALHTLTAIKQYRYLNFCVNYPLYFNWSFKQIHIPIHTVSLLSSTHYTYTNSNQILKNIPSSLLNHTILTLYSLLPWIFSLPKKEQRHNVKLIIKLKTKSSDFRRPII